MRKRLKKQSINISIKVGGSMKNIIVVGCGGSGALIARKIAEELNYQVRIIERRPHIAGNMYDETDEHGFLIQRYGPHHFYTNNYKIFQVFEHYGEFFTHYYKSKNYIDGKYLSMPFNFYTLEELVGKKTASILIPKMREYYKGRERVPVIELLKNDDIDIATYGNLLFDKAFRPYIAKMWDIPIEKIDSYVLGRRSMAMSYDERVADYDFQGLPKRGFTKIFEKLLDHPNIKVFLNTDALEHISFHNNRVFYDSEYVDCLVFTGPIDELFSYQYGELPYRSLDIKWDYYDNQDSVLPTEGVSFPQADGYVRKIEYRKMMWNTTGLKGTVISTEYPVPYNKKLGNEPYYPVVTEESQRLYNQYLEFSKQFGNIFLCGRLAEFRYIDMHTCVEHALDYFENIRAYLKRDSHD